MEHIARPIHTYECMYGRPITILVHAGRLESEHKQNQQPKKERFCIPHSQPLANFRVAEDTTRAHECYFLFTSEFIFRSLQNISINTQMFFAKLQNM